MLAFHAIPYRESPTAVPYVINLAVLSSSNLSSEEFGPRWELVDSEQPLKLNSIVLRRSLATIRSVSHRTDPSASAVVLASEHILTER
ncbi:Hypothetical protein NTJ_07788 [Nesidiocoris tenuis]|uniref:Uncharacterized protein n=1 Tax=Nesidiocoris tenuis TaxID=355587 RepID=A0ABN7AUJ1_9HEMI|nr:Hypothetical protein NTJ_07788 [Nesidiocoris tenuis]